MGYTVNQAFIAQNEIYRQLRGLYASARRMGYTQETLDDEVKKIFDSIPSKVYKRRGEYLRGVSNVLWDEMHERDLETIILFKRKVYSLDVNTKHHELLPEICRIIEVHRHYPRSLWWIEANKQYSEWEKI